MLRHIVMIKWKPEADGASRQALRDALATLRTASPGIHAFQWGENVGRSPNAYDLAVVMDFDDRESFARYLASPAHHAYVQGPARAAVGTMAAIQHTLE